MARLEPGGAGYVGPVILRERIQIAALGILDDDASDPVTRIVVVGAERPLKAHEHGPVLPGEADDDDRLPAAHEPVHRRAGRLLARVEAVVVVVIARVHALQDRGDRDRIEAGVVALIELALPVV
ncbi:MAG: hypothetical protein DMD49_13265 [Gemmatimonadetes bacterium]|nr:MAG: hypothetical protein DMD49_13265 [Gemmatimonadota bacterium]